MEIKKKDIRKIKNATKEELGKLQEEYKAVTENIHGMSPVGLLLIAIAGVLVILYFRYSFFDLVGLAMIAYPLYVFIHRGAHRKGYFEGYYDMMTKLGSRDEDTNPEKSDKSQDK
jgi:hypothetical protein